MEQAHQIWGKIKAGGIHNTKYVVFALIALVLSYQTILEISVNYFSIAKVPLNDGLLGTALVLSLLGFTVLAGIGFNQKLITLLAYVSAALLLINTLAVFGYLKDIADFVGVDEAREIFLHSLNVIVFLAGIVFSVLLFLGGKRAKETNAAWEEESV
ncbi:MULTISPECIES: hypothetical protein [Gammaproteobacteria]|uniref:hypothetical protein n=1 Tax=Gammaproteobacteria TaxID=1236 RepID=UPI000DD0CA67|nr:MULTISPECIES: hypothetical protein [Gammaproteobacteria]RTE86643.1 hypothetical protein DQX04_08805 [Aliidiomarina sp. B3213]TCZ90802.1 hypothetical protein EYQ95_08240 [Lysobacter sp. N42]